MTGLLIFLGTMLLAFLASSKLKSVYNRNLQVPASSGLTGAEAAERILRAAGINDVQIHETNQELGDHYDPTQKQLVLSSANYHGRSVAALGVSAHECGHAIQHKAAYAPLNIRMAAVGITNIANTAAMIIPWVAFGFGMIAPKTAFFLMAVALGIVMLFQLITLPVEFDASRRAKVILSTMGMVRGEQEEKGVRETLNAAALTYVAAFISSLAWMLHYLLPLLGGGRDEEC